MREEIGDTMKKSRLQGMAKRVVFTLALPVVVYMALALIRPCLLYTSDL